jgi:hypothetical protein
MSSSPSSPRVVNAATASTPSSLILFHPLPARLGRGGLSCFVGKQSGSLANTTRSRMPRARGPTAAQRWLFLNVRRASHALQEPQLPTNLPAPGIDLAHRDGRPGATVRVPRSPGGNDRFTQAPSGALWRPLRSSCSQPRAWPHGRSASASAARSHPRISGQAPFPSRRAR